MQHSPSSEAERSLASQDISSHFMEPKFSSPHSLKPVSCPYPEPDQPVLAKTYVVFHILRHTKGAVQVRGSVNRLVASEIVTVGSC
jgi:hypothetical protein